MTETDWLHGTGDAGGSRDGMASSSWEGFARTTDVDHNGLSLMSPNPQPSPPPAENAVGHAPQPPSAQYTFDEWSQLLAEFEQNYKECLMSMAIEWQALQSWVRNVSRREGPA